MMKPLLLDSPAPFCVLFVWDAVLNTEKGYNTEEIQAVPKPAGHP